MAILAAAAAIFAGVLLWQTAIAAGHALWPGVIVAILAFAALVEWLWHRRQLAEIHEKRLILIGRWRKVHHFQRWPQACEDCGQIAYDFRSCRDHDNPETSPCAADMYVREQKDLPPLAEPPWKVDIWGHDTSSEDDQDALTGGPET